MVVALVGAGCKDSAAPRHATQACALLWPLDLRREHNTIAAQQYVPSFPAAAPQQGGERQLEGEDKEEGEEPELAGATAARQQAQQHATAMTAWLAEHCPEVRLADLQQWAFTLLACTLTSLPPDKRPEQFVLQVLYESQRLLDAGHSYAAWAAAAAWQVSRWWQPRDVDSTARDRQLTALLEGVRDYAVPNKCECSTTGNCWAGPALLAQAAGAALLVRRHRTLLVVPLLTVFAGFDLHSQPLDRARLPLVACRLAAGG